MKYKALFTDFDGTLLADDFTVSSRNIEAIKAYVNAGGKFFISTGRLFSSIYPHLISLGVESEKIIVAQGAEIYDVGKKERIYEKQISLEELKRVWDYIFCEMKNNPDLTPLMYINDNVYFANVNPEHANLFCDILKVQKNVIDESFYEYVKKNGYLPTKILVMNKEDKVKDFMKRGNEQIGDIVNFCASRGFLVEIMPINVNKGEAVKVVAESYNIPLEDVVAIGDSDNDLSMIKVAGLGVCVENGFDNIKAQADYISTSCNEDAIADVIYKYCLEEKC